MLNDKSSKASSSSGIGFCGLLTIAFIVLKLLHVIEWSWVWVLAPMWIGLLIGMIILAVVVVIALKVD